MHTSLLKPRAPLMLGLATLLVAYAVPWQAAQFPSGASPEDVFCGAAIRDATHVVTAAHCVDSQETDEPHELLVAAGLVDRVQPSQSLQVRAVTTVGTHPRYDEGGHLEYDAAVLTLGSPLALGLRSVPRPPRLAWAAKSTPRG